VKPLLCLLLLSSLLVPAARAQAVADTTRQAPGLRPDERLPVFPGGGPTDDVRRSNQRFSQFLADSLHMPAQSVRDGITGRVWLSFAVDAEGRSTELKLVQGLRADVDTAVLRHARRLYRVRWQPGTQAGRPVRVAFTVPITVNKSLATGPVAFADSLTIGRGYNKALVLPTSRWDADEFGLPGRQGLVYGSCVQRLPGAASGGLGQYVRLANVSTGKAVRIDVKPAFLTRAQHSFCYALPPGRYALYKYEFTESKFYGGRLHEEDLHKALLNGQPLRTTRYEFTVSPGQLHYVGTWDFSQAGQPTFRNDKAVLDSQLQAKLKGFDLSRAVVAVPQ
jgi:TonB family protein